MRGPRRDHHRDHSRPDVLAFTANENGIAQAGANPAPRQAALHEVPAWITALLATYP